jgi:cell division septal protein FtsQ
MLCAVLTWGAYGVWGRVTQADYFKLRTIRISGNKTLSEQRIRYLLAIPDEHSLLAIDLPRLGARLSRHPLIRTVALRRRLPRTLEVTIQEQSPALVIRSREQSLIVDTEGHVLRDFDPEQDAALPELILKQSHALSPGIRLDLKEIERAFELMHVYRASPLNDTMRLRALSVSASGASVWKVEPYTFQLRFGEGQIVSQLGRLPHVLTYITNQGLEVRAVDLSYRNRIIVIPKG